MLIGKSHACLREEKDMSAARARTTYRLAHPPPRSKHQQRLHIPPKSLLQLQVVSEDGHIEPFVDVVPAAQHSSTIQKRLTGQLRCPRHIGLNDLVIVYNDRDDEHGVTAHGHGSQGSSDMMAMLTGFSDSSGQSKATISMGTGAVWTATRLRSGSYEFQTEQHGEHRVARWAPKQCSLPIDVSDNGRKVQMRGNNSAFTFSLLDPNERRHAVIATLNPEGIVVCNEYRSPQPVSPDSDVNKIDKRSGSSPVSSDGTRPTTKTSNELRMFILASGAWVGLNESYSPHFTSVTPSISNRPANLFHALKPSNGTVAEPQHHHQPADSTKERRPSWHVKRSTESTSLIPHLPPNKPYEDVPRRRLSAGATSTQESRNKGSSSTRLFRSARSPSDPQHHSDLKSSQDDSSIGDISVSGASFHERKGFPEKDEAIPVTSKMKPQTEGCFAHLFRRHGSR